MDQREDGCDAQVEDWFHRVSKFNERRQGGFAFAAIHPGAALESFDIPGEAVQNSGPGAGAVEE